MRFQKLRFDLRRQFLLLMSVLLLLPWFAIDLVRQLERYANQSLEDNILVSAQALAYGLQQQADQFVASDQASQNIVASLYAVPLTHDVVLDGYGDEWDDFNSVKNNFRFADEHGEFLFGTYKDTVYLWLSVPDKTVNYATGLNDKTADYVLLHFDISGKRTIFKIKTEAPGWLDITANDGSRANLQGYWQETANGYNIELKLSARQAPLKKLQRLGISLVTHHNGHITIYPVTQTQREMLFLPTMHLQAYLQDFALPTGRRVWLLDNNYNVLARTGSLNTEESVAWLNPLFGWILAAPNELVRDQWSQAIRLQRDEVKQAQQGQAAVVWHAVANSQQFILSAAYPIKQGESSVGVIVVEETTNRIQQIKRSVMGEILNVGLLVITLLALVLLTYAYILVKRLRRLRRTIAGAADRKNNPAQRDSIKAQPVDEIDDLNQTFWQMHEQVQHYQDYLENLAARLSHEIRTPVAIIKSSLEMLALKMNQDDQSIQTLTRAQNGVQRLSDMISRMQEARSLEQSIQQTDKQTIVLNDLLNQCLHNHQLLHPEQNFNFENIAGTIKLSACPDLLVQMMDKLLSNAVDFSDQQRPITLSLQCESEQVTIRLSNSGPIIPEHLKSQLFDSMVSHREQGSGKHLGLGLYIVKLIVDFHQGNIQVSNLPDNNGVCFIIRFLCMPKN